MGYRVLVTGSRDWSDRAEVFNALLDILDNTTEDNQMIILNGRAHDGADQIVHEWYLMFDHIVKEIPFFADWMPNGRNGKRDLGAGLKRNSKMVEYGADICLAFPTICPGHKRSCPQKRHYSHGTADCMRKAEAAGIPVKNFGEPLDSP